MTNSNFFIVGKHPVTEALKNPKRKVLRIFLTEESKKTINRENQNKNLLKNVKVFFKTKKELDKYCKNEQILHQGFVAEIEPLMSGSLKEFVISKKDITFACLQNVTDPRNIGSVIRSAASFKIDGLIVKERHFPSESKLMYKAASGSMEYLNIFEVSNINSTLKNLKDKNNITLICLDGVTDPRNIGSLIRSAASFNIDGIIIKERNFPSESKLMYKAASGAIEYINIFQVSNINSTLKNLKEKNFCVSGFDGNGKKDFIDIEWKGNNILLFGSEGLGMHKHTSKYADFLVKIEINEKIESLNISNSAAIVFHHLSYLKKKS